MGTREAVAGKVVVVTGGARGIGLSIATGLDRLGARVAIGDIDEAAARDAAAERGLAFHGKLDVAEADSFAAFLDAAESRLGPVDVLVNNAGIMPTGQLVDETEGMTRRVLDVNTYGVILGTKLALRGMLPRRRGHVINVASVVGENPNPGLATYCASKAAVIAFTETVRREYRSSGVRISMVLPTFTDTELIAGTRAPSLLLAQPDQVADAVARLIARPRRRVTVTRLVGALIAMNKLTPHRIGEVISRTIGVDRGFIEGVDTVARQSYEQRLRDNQPPDHAAGER